MRLLQSWRGARCADAAGDLQPGDAGPGGGVVFGKRIRRSLARGEESRGGAIVPGPSAVRARAIVQRGVACNALIEQFDVAPGHCFAVHGTGDGHRVTIDVAHVDGAWPVAVITRLDQRVAPAQRFPHRDPSGPADGECVAHGGGDGRGSRVPVRGGTAIVGADIDGQWGSV